MKEMKSSSVCLCLRNPLFMVLADLWGKVEVQSGVTEISFGVLGGSLALLYVWLKVIFP